MHCKCIEKVKAKLIEYHGAESDVCLDLKQTIDMETMKMGAALPPLYYSYMDGKRRRKSYVTFTFCPFCGKENK